MISPRTGRPQRAHRCARGSVVFALASGLVLGPVLTPFSPAAADTVDDEETGLISLALTAGLHGVVKPDATLSSSVTIANDSDADLAAGQVTVEINRTPLTNAAALSAWLDGAEVAGTFSALGSEDVDAVAADDTAIVSVLTPPTVLGTISEGVYPLRATLTPEALTDTDASPDGEADDEADAETLDLGANSVLIVTGDSARQVSVMVPITATPANGTLLTNDELTVLTAPDGALTAQLDGVAGTSAIIAVDPLIPAAIRALGTSAPATALTWLDRLELLPNERFALQPGDADATVQVRAGLTEPLEPLAFTTYLDPADFAVPDAATPSPSPAATASEPALPSAEELLSVRSAEPGILWPVADLQTADLAVFDAFLGTDATTILPSSAISGSRNALAEVDGHDLLVLDSAASAAVSAATVEDDDAMRDQSIAAGIAQVVLSGSDSVLIGLDRAETRSAAALREAILSLSAVADTVSLNTLRTTETGSVTLTAETSGERAEALTALLSEEADLTAFASILDEPLNLRAPERLRLLRLIGVGRTADFTEAVAAHQSTTDTTLNAVGVQQPSPIQLFTSAAPLPVWVRNDLPWPVNLTLTAKPSDARLDVQPRRDVVAQAGSNERVKVPVEARVGSGVLTVDFSLTSPTGVAIGADQTATVTVRAEWEGIGLGILGSLIGLLLVFGVVRTVRRRRKDAGSVEQSDAPAEQDTNE
ncbi:DUF6049 family protein [uncultured Microbacterium sp.]|uniref:DUF6049 family protein n=1 Tax=uncultured Microbacterium sp. TaxID=191216 RepID=UPI002623255E|nr:DUF6049 family protein [uncultured Microbacterium sp.]